MRLPCALRIEKMGCKIAIYPYNLSLYDKKSDIDIFNVYFYGNIVCRRRCGSIG